VLAVSLSDDLAVGLVLGLVLGAMASPLIRSWLIWREWSSASQEADRHSVREAQLTHDVLDRIEASACHRDDDSDDSPATPNANDGRLRG
jgi:hypothetical protein